MTTPLPYEDAYALVKASAENYDQLITAEMGRPDLVRVRRVCEMILARTYDDWYWGDPASNISKAIHEHCRALSRTEKRPVAPIRRVGTLLAWSYVQLDHDTDDAFLLLEHVLPDLGDDDHILPIVLQSEMRAILPRWRNDRGIPPDLNVLSESERLVWDEVTRWAIDPASSWTPVTERIDAAKAWLASIVPDSVTKPIFDAVRGGLLALHDAADAMTRDEALFADLRKRGYTVSAIPDLRNVPIEVLDDVSSSSMTGGKILAALEGAGTGAGGVAFIAADIPAIMLLNLRFISQIAHTYGFDTRSQEEKTFVLNLLGAASADRTAKASFLNNLNRIALDVARNKTWKDLEEHVVVALARKIAEIIGTKLTKKKLAQLIPVVGSAVGAGSNYAYTHDNLEAARMMYRKRWLIERCIRGRAG